MCVVCECVNVSVCVSVGVYVWGSGSVVESGAGFRIVALDEVDIRWDMCLGV